MFHTFRPSPQDSWNWITLTGPDAAGFLHRLTTVNITSLEDGRGAPGCFLNPQGRIRAYFHLWRLSPSSFAFELDGGREGHWKTELLATIDQFTFGEKFALGSDPDSRCAWVLAEPDNRVERVTSMDGAVRVCEHGEDDFGRPWLTAWAEAPALEAWLAAHYPSAAPADAATLERWRIEALAPRPDLEITDSTVPLEVGLRRAVAENKGCYPGQEVIEKIISLGTPARRLVQLSGPGTAPQGGDRILEGAAEVGRITSASSAGDRFVALGIVRKTHAKEGLELDIAGDRTRSARIARIAPYA